MRRLGSTRYFARQLKQLKKQYRHVEQDIEPLKSDLESGATPGDRLQGLNDALVYKVRIPNRDAGRGKSGGYRIIYYVQTAENVYLLLIYSKSEQEDVPTALILGALAEADSNEENESDETSDEDKSDA